MLRSIELLSLAQFWLSANLGVWNCAEVWARNGVFLHQKMTSPLFP